METARELKIKGLLNMKDGIEINVDESETNHDRTIDSSCEESGVLRSMDEKIEVIKEESIYVNSNLNLIEALAEIIERNDGF